MASKKEFRQLAIEREMARRYAAASEACPISRDTYEALLDYVSDQIVESGHRHDFSITKVYLKAHGQPLEQMLAFLSEHGLRDDWAFFMEGDPNRIFGPTADRIARMPLKQSDLKELLSWLERQLEDHDCDHTHRLTQSWLNQHKQQVTRVIGALMAQGGFCDCEVVLNVEADSIYPKALNIRVPQRRVN